MHVGIALQVAVIAVVLAGCMNKTLPMVEKGPLTLTRNQGAILFVMQRDPKLLHTPLTMTIRRFDPRTNQIIQATSASDDAGDTGSPDVANDPNVIAVKFANQAQLGRNDRHWTYVVPPGHYAIESVEITKTYTNAQFIGGNPFVGLAATLVVAAVTATAAEINHEEVSFNQDGVLTADAPRFSVTGGKATYIGDFSFDGEERISEVAAHQNSHDSFNDPDRNVTRTVSDMRIILDYGYNPDDVAWYASRRGIRPEQLLGQRLTAFDNARFLVKDFSSADHKRRTLPRAPSLTRTATGPSATPATQRPQSSPGQQELTSLSDVALRRRFLAGEISVEEYNKARAGR